MDDATILGQDASLYISPTFGPDSGPDQNDQNQNQNQNQNQEGVNTGTGVNADDAAETDKRETQAWKTTKLNIGGGLDNDETLNNTRAAWADAVTVLAKLKREMPTVLAKMDRARAAGEYIISSRGR